eukprot:5432052-Alexandrium_andersonii.AAC.1
MRRARRAARSLCRILRTHGRDLPYPALLAVEGPLMVQFMRCGGSGGHPPPCGGQTGPPPHAAALPTYTPAGAGRATAAPRPPARRERGP